MGSEVNKGKEKVVFLSSTPLTLVVEVPLD